MTIGGPPLAHISLEFIFCDRGQHVPAVGDAVDVERNLSDAVADLSKDSGAEIQKAVVTHFGFWGFTGVSTIA
jgi:hypothetical protein